VLTGYTDEEKSDLVRAIDEVKNFIESTHCPDGYNIGMNCGRPSEQTVMHFHCHVIPRYIGDMEDPTGGVRGVIPEKQSY
jgi:diadenosine tetraphosphate (Ap4A) HIT family hydrolase